LIPMQTITLVITDDHVLVRQSLVALFNSDKRFRVVAECNSGEEAILITKRLQPDIVLLDINLPGINGFEACKQILVNQPTRIKILGVSMNAEHLYALKMVQSGAMGYVTKNSSAPELFKAVIEVYNNRKYICAEIKDKLSVEMLEENAGLKQKKPLERYEMELVNLIKQGFTSRQIAIQLGLSLRKIETQRHNILKKLKLRNVAALVNYASSLPQVL
jgi:DNA-binding NarL/FixJ family response regulator